MPHQPDYALLERASASPLSRGQSLTLHVVLKIITAFWLCCHITACDTLPTQPHLPASLMLDERLQHAYASPTADHQQAPPLTQSINQQNTLHPNLSGYHTVITGANAFAGRSILTDMATKSIDVQYYIWHNDQAGQLLLQDLWQAAERGVMVRFLLDDFNSDAELDQHLLRFSSHPNVSVRLMNPMMHRKLRMLNYVTDLKRINHRMHNKSMTFDKQISVIGGRNIGDEYLSNDETSQFADLDVLLIGDVVKDITASFEDYWQSSLAFDVETLVPPATTDVAPEPATVSTSSSSSSTSSTATPPKTPVTKSDFIAHLDKLASYQANDSTDATSSSAVTATDTNKNSSNVTDVYKQAVENSTIGMDLVNRKVPFRWVNITFMSDSVDKLSSQVNPDRLLVKQLRQQLGTPSDKLTIISSYFVPTQAGVSDLVGLAKQGVKVKILTNSFKATDVAAVHSGYAPWRVPLLQAGVELYELKAIASEEDRNNKLWKARSQSATSLHAKTFAVDNDQVFIGSYNVDPRSANINTEMGVIINDDKLAAQLHAAIGDDLLPLAYKVVLSNTGHLQWQTLEDGKQVTYTQEPDVEFSDKLWIKLLASLPIDWLL